MTDYQGVLALIKAESSITSLLGFYYDLSKTPAKVTTNPLAVVGTIAEDQKGLPAISIRNATNLPTTDFGISDTVIQLHCYGANEPDSMALAQACYDFFRNSKGGVTGFASSFDASILTTTPSEKITLTVVELRLSYR